LIVPFSRITAAWNSNTNNKENGDIKMATTATTVDMATKPEMITFGLIGTKTPDGTNADGTEKFKTELKAASRDKEIAKAKEDGTLLFEQSFTYDKAGTLEGIIEVIKDSEEALAIFNAGLKVRFNSKVVALLTEVDESGDPVFQPQEAAYDMRDALNEPSQKRNLSPIDKAAKALLATGLSSDQVAALLAQVRANIGGQTAPTAE
jgi:hypothetical protein